MFYICTYYLLLGKAEMWNIVTGILKTLHIITISQGIPRYKITWKLSIHRIISYHQKIKFKNSNFTVSSTHPSSNLSCANTPTPHIHINPPHPSILLLYSHIYPCGGSGHKLLITTHNCIFTPTPSPLTHPSHTPHTPTHITLFSLTVYPKTSMCTMALSIETGSSILT